MDAFEQKPIYLVCDQRLFDMHIETKMMELETRIWMRAMLAVHLLICAAIVFWPLLRR